MEIVAACFLTALSLGGEPAQDAFPAPVFRVATLFTAQEMRGALAGDSGRDQAVEWCKRHGVEHAFVESFRDGYEAKEETLVAVRDRFRAAGLLVSGCVTPTDLGKRSTNYKTVSCYTAPETRAQIRGIFERAAKLFEAIMIDDFLFTDCECEDCRKAKGDGPWSAYRIRLMNEVAEKDILAPARAVRPGVRVIIKYPQWYEDFHNRGYDVAGQTALYPAIWVGTETRDPENARWGRKAQYEAYFILRWLGAIGGEKTGGGWFDPYGTSPATYVEQARQTVLAGAREMLLFCHASLVEPRNALCTEALIPELPALRDLAARVRGRRPVGIAAPKPPNSQPAEGEDYIFDYVGMLGIPLVPCTEIPGDAPAAFISSHAARDARTLEWLRASPGRPVLVTAAAEKALPADALTAGGRSVGRISWSKDPREIMSLPQETLDKLRNDLLAPLGVRFSAPGRVALYIFEPHGAAGGLAAMENFNDTPVDVKAEGLGEAARAEGERILLPRKPDSGGFRMEPDGRLAIPARGMIAYPLATDWRDAFGGFIPIQGKKTGFFHAEKIDGRDWLVTPEGHGFLSKGVNHLAYRGDRGRKSGKAEYNESVSKKYGSEEGFHRAALGRLRGWGFNTLGAWCDAGSWSARIIPYTVNLDLLAATTPDAWLKGNTADVFSEEFEKAVRKRAEEKAKPLAGDPWLLGYFTDNELSFGPDWRLKTTLLERMLALPESAPGRKAVEKHLAEHGGDAKAAAPSFAGLYARRYFQICRDAIRAADPNHLILGARFAGPPIREVARAARGLVDVFSVNVYSLEPNTEVFELVAEDAGTSVIVGEFAFRGKDSGLPNTRGAGPVVESQEARAQAYVRYVEKLLRSPRVVGYHWFQHQDQPAEGRFDGEDSNYGLVNKDDRPYEAFTGPASAMNARAEIFARDAARAAAAGK